mmetsp:Transcript_21801/g.53877  ORF Transcript_21801/g.53877 Transcript_21801/m.53877 type:complete len:205 (+) Transcript_21801:495-1109(+)
MEGDPPTAVAKRLASSSASEVGYESNNAATVSCNAASARASDSWLTAFRRRSPAVLLSVSTVVPSYVFGFCCARLLFLEFLLLLCLCVIMLKSSSCLASRMISVSLAVATRTAHMSSGVGPSEVRARSDASPQPVDNAALAFETVADSPLSPPAPASSESSGRFPPVSGVTLPLSLALCPFPFVSASPVSPLCPVASTRSAPSV